MPTSLFVEHHSQGLAFYINGDLQFDTADEAIYHEHLVVPAIALATQRFPETRLKVLICGGGDGLAARDVLRFSSVSEITLVDYNPAVLELGRTVFKPFNQGSLQAEKQAVLGESKVTIYTQDAVEFVAALPDACYHVVICDFTFPTCAEETRVYSQEWFQQIRRILHSAGVMSTNGVSPNQRSQGFWCLYQTLRSADLYTKPLQVAIPSFQRHGYGNWGFLLASTQPFDRAELATMALPTNLSSVQPQTWLTAFLFPLAIAQLRDSVNLHTLESPQLFYYLLNPKSSAVSELAENSEVDFLEISESSLVPRATTNLLQIDAVAKVWLRQLKQANPITEIEIEQLLPVQHRYHSANLNRAWLDYLKHLLNQIDLQQLLASLSDRAQNLPPQLVQELQQLAEKVRTSQPITYLSENMTEMMTILAVSLLLANLSPPDAVFAKGFSSSGSSSGVYYDDGYYSPASFGTNILGFWMFIFGVIWLGHLYNRSDE